MSGALPSARELDYWPTSPDAAYALIAVSGWAIPLRGAMPTGEPASVFSIVENDPPYYEVHRFPPVRCERAHDRRKELVRTVRRLNREALLSREERAAFCPICRRDPDPSDVGRAASSAWKNGRPVCAFHHLMAVTYDRVREHELRRKQVAA